MTALAHDFPAYSARSRHWIDFAEAGELELLGREVDRTRTELVLAALQRADKGQLTRAEVDQLDRTWAAIGADLCRDLTGNGELHTVAWTDKVKALRAEVERRRRGYPADVDKGRLTPADARAQLERLEAVHAHYFHQGFAFDGTRDELRTHAEALSDHVEQWDTAA